MHCPSFLVDPKSPVPTIRRSLSKIFNGADNTDNTTEATSVAENPSAQSPQPSTSAEGNVPNNVSELDGNSGTDSQAGSQEVDEPVKKDVGKRATRKRGGKK